MESYHTNPSASRADESHRLRPYQFIGTPAISLLLDAIVAHCIVGELIAPGVRQLAEWAGVSEGCVSRCLRQLVEDAWIDYDGRTIMLQRSPDQAVDRDTDQAVDRDTDQAVDRDTDQAVDRVLLAQSNAAEHAPNRDRVETGRMVSIINKQQQVAVVRDSGGSGGVPPVTIDHPVALLLSELLPPPGRGVLDKVLSARPPWTPQQIRDRYAYDKPRIENSGGKNTWGIFWDCLKAGERAPQRADPAPPLDPQSYADDPAFQLGGDGGPPDEAQQRQAAYADAHWRAVALLGPGAPFREMAIVVERLVSGDSDQAALAALEQHRSAVRR